MSKRIEYLLNAESELRCEVSDNQALTLKLLDGNAEIFGIEMALNKEYKFLDENFAVYSWYGCKLEAQSSGGENLYTADSTPMVSYVNTHAQLEFRRDVALANQDYGPRVLVVGDQDNGKSSSSRILACYAARLDRFPIFVDLDVSQGSVSIPGSLTAVQLDKTSINIEEGFGHPMPLTYYFGHPSPKDNVELYNSFIEILATQVKARLDSDVDTKASGIIVNTFGWVDGGGMDVIHHCIKCFNIDVVLVMNHDKLFATLSGLSNQGITVVKLPTSGGIVRRESAVRRRLRKFRIKEYFYGKSLVPSLTFAPARIDLRLSQVTCLRAGGIQLSEGMRAVGDDIVQSASDLTIVSPSSDLLNCVLAVLNPPEDGQSYENTTAAGLPVDLINANVAGFIVVVQLNLEADSMTVLSPCPGALPSKYLLMGSIKWSE